MVVTLVGETQAKVGTAFMFHGPLPECRDCKRKTVCFNLEEGTLYEIIGVRDKHHDCNVHEGGVRVVELKKAPIETTIDSKHAIEGSTVNIDREACLHRGCEHYKACFILGTRNNKKYRVARVKGDVNCPDHRALKIVLLEV
ncbi:MAG: UPF0179 family protein [Methanomassiliicoccales archaeon]|nr:MAG: UPF0179 family protein [Methanomassiliicoccales archaeon]